MGYCFLRGGGGGSSLASFRRSAQPSRNSLPAWRRSWAAFLASCLISCDASYASRPACRAAGSSRLFASRRVQEQRLRMAAIATVMYDVRMDDLAIDSATSIPIGESEAKRSLED